MTFQVQSCLLTCWTVREWDVVICDIVEEMDLFFFEKQCGCNGVDWSVAPALVEETTIMVKCVEEVKVRLGPQPIETSDFKVGPLIRCYQHLQDRESYKNHSRSGSGCKIFRRRRSRSPWSCPPQYALGAPS